MSQPALKLSISQQHDANLLSPLFSMSPAISFSFSPFAGASFEALLLQQHDPAAASASSPLPRLQPNPRTVVPSSQSSSHEDDDDFAGSVVEGRTVLVQERWSDEVLSMSVKDLNAYLARHALTAEQTADLKRERRRMKNRTYAKEARDRQRAERQHDSREPDWEAMPLDAVQKEIATIRAQIGRLKAKQDKLRAILDTQQLDG